MNEQNYIRYRKIKGFLNSLAFYTCRLFPIDKNLISLCTFEGKGGFGCNPKYIAEELHRRNPDYKFVWLVNDESWEKEFPSYIKKVRNSSLWSRAYWLTRSKVWIDNYRKPLGTVKRKGQIYINVNHYTLGIKCTGLLRGDGFSKMAYIVSKNDSDMIDELVIDSKWCEECFDKALVYDGHMLKTGAPRCDVLYGDRTEQKLKFRKKHGIPDDGKVLMFAPTFREGAKDGVRSVYSEVWSIDFERLIKKLESKFGGDWYICVRVHPQLAPTFAEYKDEKLKGKIIDESQADDFYEILAGMDAYITDYSSAVFEAGFAKIPSFIYADDIDKYSNDRGSLYWNLATDPHDHVTNNKTAHPNMDLVFPFPIATNNDEMDELIDRFDAKSYEACLDEFHDKIGLVFDGRASEKLADKIEQMK
ncbi:MAG: hypothetical protein E7302_13400 [Butyrivibrio sp.]|nr:hypothetical protein [Butyrivibrio sp.]